MPSKIACLQPFRLLILGLCSRESIQWSLLLSFRNDLWVGEKNLWRLGWVHNRSSPNPQSNETVSPSFGSRWRKRKRLSQICFWLDINEQIYLLNTLWLFCSYEIIVSQFSCNQMKLDWKKKNWNHFLTSKFSVFAVIVINLTQLVSA